MSPSRPSGPIGSCSAATGRSAGWSVSYADVVAATTRLVDELTIAEQDAILGGTASRVYRVG